MTQRRVPGSATGVRTDSERVDVRVEETGEGTVYRAEPRYAATPVVEETPVIERYGTYTGRRDKIRWGPILAGLATVITSMLVLTVLGLAIGLSAFDPDDDGVGTAAAIWSALSALVSFFLGGWVAGKTASVHGDDNALLNGFMVGASALALLLLLTGMGLGNLLGGIGSNIADIARLSGDTVSGVDPNTAAQNVRQGAVDAYDEARDAAWGTLAGLVLALGAATLGGLVGHRNRHDHATQWDRD
jgi:hypothetical protein